MSLDLFDRTLFDLLNKNARQLEDELSADVVFYNGRIDPSYFRHFRDFIEKVQSESKRENETIAVLLRTGGGSAETAERMVNILRKHYVHVHFVVPDFAMSAGTILCMAGDKIYMDYSSSLGPIDPQIPAPDTGEYVPALGYLDKVKEITDKGSLAPADVILLKSLDLAKLALFEQARDLSKDLLEDWLVRYKFKDWVTHRTHSKGTEVTPEEKQTRATEIATALADHKKWRSHGRNLDTVKLKQIGIEIDDYSDDTNRRKMIREYNDHLTGYIDRIGIPFFIHSHLVGR